MFIKRRIFYEVRLSFYRSLSTFWSKFGGPCTKGFYSLACVVKLNVIQPQPKYKTRNFQNLIKKRLLRDIH